MQQQYGKGASKMRQRCVNPARSYNLRADELKEKVEKENKEKAGSVCLDDTRPPVSPPAAPLTVFPKTVILDHSSLPGVRKACLCYRVRAAQNTDKSPPGRKSLPGIQDTPYPGRKSLPEIQGRPYPGRNIVPEIQDRPSPGRNIMPGIQGRPSPGRNIVPEIQGRPYPGRNIMPEIQGTLFRHVNNKH